MEVDSDAYMDESDFVDDDDVFDSDDDDFEVVKKTVAKTKAASKSRSVKTILSPRNDNVMEDENSSMEAAPVKATAKKGGKTVEEIYQKKTQLEHILLRPDTYSKSMASNDSDNFRIDFSVHHLSTNSCLFSSLCPLQLARRNETWRICMFSITIRSLNEESCSLLACTRSLTRS